jgi:hypothetical protein
MPSSFDSRGLRYCDNVCTEEQFTFAFAEMTLMGKSNRPCQKAVLLHGVGTADLTFHRMSMSNLFDAGQCRRVNGDPPQGWQVLGLAMQQYQERKLNAFDFVDLTVDGDDAPDAPPAKKAEPPASTVSSTPSRKSSGRAAVVASRRKHQDAEERRKRALAATKKQAATAIATRKRKQQEQLASKKKEKARKQNPAAKSGAKAERGIKTMATTKAEDASARGEDTDPGSTATFLSGAPPPPDTRPAAGDKTDERDAELARLRAELVRFTLWRPVVVRTLLVSLCDVMKYGVMVVLCTIGMRRRT